MLAFLVATFPIPHLGEPDAYSSTAACDGRLKVPDTFSPGRSGASTKPVVLKMISQTSLYM
jgi:hypothetical protein